METHPWLSCETIPSGAMVGNTSERFHLPQQEQNKGRHLDADPC
jgi:hypothetical protein